MNALEKCALISLGTDPFGLWLLKGHFVKDFETPETFMFE